MKPTEEQKKLLTEKLLDEPWYAKGAKEWNGKYYEPLINRTFTTPDDQQACMEALVKKGRWGRFCIFTLGKFELVALCPDESEEGCYESDWSCWLFRPVDENDEWHFCRLAAEWTEDKYGQK